MIDIAKNKQTFLTICRNNIHRNGIEDLINWLEDTDFFNAPASSRYHLDEIGGLCQHSLNVYHRFMEDIQQIMFPNDDIPENVLEQATILALFHDFVKIDFYEESTRKVKDEYGTWISVPYFSINNRSELSGHGVKSARIVSKFLELSDEEFMAITYHMGFASDEGRTNPNVINEVYNRSSLALLLNIADQKATFIDERK